MNYSAEHQAVLGVLSPGFGGTVLPEYIKEYLDNGLGGITLFGSNTPDLHTVAQLTSQIHSRNPECLISIDEESGDVTRIWAENGSDFPSPYLLGRANDLSLTQAVFHNLGGILADIGIDMTFAPVADLTVEGRNPIVGVRSFGENPELVANHIKAAITGLQDSGIAACVKHFPGHGRTVQDSHHDLPRLSTNFKELLSTDLLPFTAAIESGTAGVMLGHLLLEEIDSNPASLSKNWYQKVLREDLKFNGLAVTDALDMGALGGIANIDKSALKAVQAGADLLCLSGTANQKEIVNRIVETVSKNITSELFNNLAQSKLRINAAKQKRVSSVIETVSLENLAKGISVKGSIPKIKENFGLISLAAEPTVAAGNTGWGIENHLIKKGFQKTSFDNADVKIIELRDIWRNSDQLQKANTLLKDYPEAVFVDFGWPTSDLDAPSLVRVFGASNIQAEIAANLFSRP